MSKMSKMSKMLQSSMVALVLIISGCSTPPIKPTIVIKYQYVVPEAPSELYEIPPHIKDLDLNNSTQKDVATWISDRYKRSVVLQTKIIKLKEYQDSAKQIAKSKNK